MLFKINYLKFCFLFLVIICCSCSYRSRDILFKTDKQINKDSVKTVYVVQKGNGDKPGPHRIEPGDILQIRNLQNESILSGEEKTTQVIAQAYPVGADGFVVIPVLGRINLTGLTKEEASNKLQQLYSERILNKPVIEVNISNLQTTILGEVRSPNRYYLEHEGITLTELLGQAGGSTPRANLRMIKIIRGDKNNPEILLVNLENSQTLSDPRLVLQNHDIIYVEPNGLYGSGDKVSGFSTIAQPILLVLNTVLVIFAIVRR